MKRMLNGILFFVLASRLVHASQKFPARSALMLSLAPCACCITQEALRCSKRGCNKVVSQKANNQKLMAIRCGVDKQFAGSFRAPNTFASP